MKKRGRKEVCSLNRKGGGGTERGQVYWVSTVLVSSAPVKSTQWSSQKMWKGHQWSNWAQNYVRERRGKKEQMIADRIRDITCWWYATVPGNMYIYRPFRNYSYNQRILIFMVGILDITGDIIQALWVQQAELFPHPLSASLQSLQKRKTPVPNLFPSRSGQVAQC